MKALTFSCTLCAALLLPVALASASIAAPPRAGEVVIYSTGDRLTPGYRVTVEPNGVLSSVLVPFHHGKPLRRKDRMIAANRRRLFSDLANAGPLTSLPTEASGSAPQIFVRYQGRRTPNLRAASSQGGQVLYQDVKQILQVLRLPIPDQP